MTIIGLGQQGKDNQKDVIIENDGAIKWKWDQQGEENKEGSARGQEKEWISKVKSIEICSQYEIDIDWSAKNNKDGSAR